MCPENPFGRLPRLSFVRRGRGIDLTNVPVRKLDRANRQRGITVTEIQPDGNGGLRGFINKVVIRGDE